MTTVTETVAEELEHAEGEVFNAGDLIMHHIIDGREIENPFTGTVYTLPTWEVWGVDVSLSRNIVMMWIASAILLLLVALAVRRVREPVPRGLRSVFEMFVLYIRDEVARKVIADAGYGDYFIHSIGHHLGLETHDVAPDEALKQGAVITIEPGIYIRDEAIGVRIEDDVLVTREGSKVLSAKIPKTVAAVENAMS